LPACPPARPPVRLPQVLKDAERVGKQDLADSKELQKEELSRFDRQLQGRRKQQGRQGGGGGQRRRGEGRDEGGEGEKDDDSGW
jgi:hypothetical protein